MNPQIPVEWQGLDLLFCPESWDFQSEEIDTPEAPGCEASVDIKPDSGHLLLDTGIWRCLSANPSSDDLQSYWRLINEHNQVYNEVLEANYDTLCEKLLELLTEPPDPSDDSAEW